MSERDICDEVLDDKNERMAELEADLACKDATIERLMGLLREVQVNWRDSGAGRSMDLICDDILDEMNGKNDG